MGCRVDFCSGVVVDFRLRLLLLVLTRIGDGWLPPPLLRTVVAARVAIVPLVLAIAIALAAIVPLVLATALAVTVRAVLGAVVVAVLVVFISPVSYYISLLHLFSIKRIRKEEEEEKEERRKWYLCIFGLLYLGVIAVDVNASFVHVGLI